MIYITTLLTSVYVLVTFSHLVRVKVTGLCLKLYIEVI